MRVSLSRTHVAYCNHSYENSPYRKMECINHQCLHCDLEWSLEFYINKSMVYMGSKNLVIFLMAHRRHRWQEVPPTVLELQGCQSTESRPSEVAFWPLPSWYLPSTTVCGEVWVVDGWLTGELGACILCQLHKVAFCQEDDLLGWRSWWEILGMAPFAGRTDDILKGCPEASWQEVIDNGVDSWAQIEEDACEGGIERRHGSKIGWSINI